MSKLPTAPLTSQMIQEASAWFVEFNEGEVAQSNREAFVEWLRRSPEHIRAYLQVSAHWEEAGTLSKDTAPSIDDLVALAREGAPHNIIAIAGPESAKPVRVAVPTQSPSPAAARATFDTRPRRYALAASVAIAIAGASGLFWFEQEREVFTTDIGEQRSVHLDDGTVVELNAHSKMRVRLREHERDVELIAGQALFRVAKDHTRPFTVHSGDTNVLAVGTQFDVNRHQSGTTVTVVEGRVAVFPSTDPTDGGPDLASLAQDELLASKAGLSTHPASTGNGATSSMGAAKNEILLAAGEQVTVSGGAMNRAPKADVVAATAWTQKQIVFNSTPLSDVADEFNRYNKRQLLITDSTIADTKISGEFSSTNPDSLLKGLAAMNKFSIRETYSRIEISAK